MLLNPTMSKIDKISVTVTREQHAKIKAAVERGDYASTSEVIRTALREWELKEELRRLEGERIGRLWDEGIASGAARRAADHGAPEIQVRSAAEEERQEAAEAGGMSYRLSPRPNWSWRRSATTLPKTVPPTPSASSSD